MRLQVHLKIYYFHEYWQFTSLYKKHLLLLATTHNHLQLFKRGILVGNSLLYVIICGTWMCFVIRMQRPYQWNNQTIEDRFEPFNANGPFLYLLKTSGDKGKDQWHKMDERDMHQTLRISRRYRKYYCNYLMNCLILYECNPILSILSGFITGIKKSSLKILTVLRLAKHTCVGAPQVWL